MNIIDLIRRLHPQDRARVEARTQQLIAEMKACPFCNAPMIAGPQGGHSQNLYCTNRADCRQGINVHIWRGREVFSPDLLGEIDDERYSMYATKGDQNGKG